MEIWTMTSLSKKPKVIAKTVRRVRLSQSEVKLANQAGIPLADMARAKLPKRGRPKGSKNKVAKPEGIKSFKQPDSAALQSLMKDNLQLIQDNKQLLFKIELLEHKIIGFRAVVSYLEVQANLKVTQ